MIQSSRWFFSFGDDDACFQEVLDYSLTYFENKSDPSLFARAYNDMLRYDKKLHGKPLLVKLIASKTSTTKETNRRAIITIIKTYKIKISCKGEVISDVVDIFCSITDTIATIYDDKLPENFAQQIVTVFTTTSVAPFNDLFIKLRTNLVSMELQASINITMVSTGLYLENNMKIVDYVLKYTFTVYTDFVQRGIWDKCVNVIQGQLGLLTTNPPDAVSENYVCFNCEKKGDHLRKNYPDPINKEQ